MANKVALSATFQVFGDGVSTTVAFDLLTDPIVIGLAGSNMSINFFDIAIRVPSSFVPTSATLLSSAVISGTALTLTFNSAPTGLVSVGGTLVFG